MSMKALGPRKGIVGLRKTLEFDLMFWIGYHVKLNHRNSVNFTMFGLREWQISYRLT